MTSQQQEFEDFLTWIETDYAQLYMTTNRTWSVIVFIICPDEKKALDLLFELYRQHLRDNEVYPKYYALLLREMALSKYIEVICPAVRQRGLRLRYNNFAQLLLPLPDFEEQKLIIEKLILLIITLIKLFQQYQVKLTN